MEFGNAIASDTNLAAYRCDECGHAITCGVGRDK